MKSMAKAILFTGFVAATTAAVGDKLSSAMGETDQAAASNMQADPQASDPTIRAESSTEGATTEVAATAPEAAPGDSATPSPSPDIVATTPPPAVSVARRMPARMAYEVSAFPSSVDDAGRYLIASRTHADLYGNASVMTAAVAFPTSTDDAGRYLIASRTHADIFLRVAQVEPRDSSTGGN